MNGIARFCLAAVILLTCFEAVAEADRWDEAVIKAGEDVNGSGVALNIGDRLEVVLAGNPTTGYLSFTTARSKKEPPP